MLTGRPTQAASKSQPIARSAGPADDVTEAAFAVNPELRRAVAAMRTATSAAPSPA